MPIDTTSPQISSLKIDIEKRLGRTVQSRADFTLLADEIERVTHNHIAENTLRRLWGAIKGYNTVFVRTLDVLSIYVGYAHWSAYCEALKNASGQESDIVKNGFSFKTEDLKPGERIKMSWLPDRTCIVEYVEGRTFRAIYTKNSTIQIGDTFECSMFIKGFPLFVDNLVHGGELCQRYSIGLNNGLTNLEKL